MANSSITVKVDSSAMAKYAQQMRAINRTALPVAVRNTLNNAAFEDKRKNLPDSASNNFNVKNKTFFKRYSGVIKATGYDINNMHSVMGMMDLGNKKVRTALENMRKQEGGGIVEDGFSYLKEARGGKENGKVRLANYYNPDKVISGRSKVGRGRGSNKSKFVARAFKAKKENKPMFFNSMKGNFVVSVKKIVKNGRNSVKIDFRLLMKERKHKPAKIKATHFVEEAAVKTQKTIPDFFIKEAEKQIKRNIR